MTYLIMLLMGIVLGGLCMAFAAGVRISELQNALRNSVSKATVRFYIHNAMMPDRTYGKDKDKAAWWNGALRALEHDMKEDLR